LVGSSAEAPLEDRAKPPVPGTRGWYDNAGEKVNFIIPALVALMFVAIQIVVLTTHLKS